MLKDQKLTITENQKEYLKKFIYQDAPLNIDDLNKKLKTENGKELIKIFDIENKSTPELNRYYWFLSYNIDDILFTINHNFRVLKGGLKDAIDEEKRKRKQILSE